MKLIGILTSPYVRKTRIALSEKKIGYEFVLTDLSVPDNIATKFNPLGKVPCLVLDDGKTLYDSSVIVDYLDTLTPVNRLLPEDRHARTDVKCWEALADGIMDAAVLVRLEGKRPADHAKSRLDRVANRKNSCWPESAFITTRQQHVLP